jgi:transposase
MRKSIDGLAAATRLVLGRDPCSGDVFVFCNRRRNRLKALVWEESGFWLMLKRLEKGTFNWPALANSRETEIEMTLSELAALIDGLDIRVVRRRLRFSSSSREKSYPLKSRAT